MRADTGTDPRTGRLLAEITTSTPARERAAAESAAGCAPALAATAPVERARWIRALAGPLEVPSAAGQLVDIADQETALGGDRLAGELKRAAGQLRFHADVATEGSYLESVLARDDADRWRQLLTEADVPVGEVADIGSAIRYADELGLDPIVDIGESNPPQIRHPIRYSHSRLRAITPPPLGEHNDEIRDWLAAETRRP